MSVHVNILCEFGEVFVICEITLKLTMRHVFTELSLNIQCNDSHHLHIRLV